MGFLFSRSRQQRDLWGISNVSQLIPPDTLGGSRHHQPRPYMTADAAMRHSAVWSAVRLRADVLSTLPLDTYKVDETGLQVPADAPRVLSFPGGDAVDAQQWLYNSQVELDRTGNSIGLIKSRDNRGFPTRIDLQPTSKCSVIVGDDGELTGYRISGREYDVADVWHEKQYTVSGLHVGLSPVAYAAYQLGEYEDVLAFAREWFSNSAVPRVHLKNTAKKLAGKEAAIVREAFRASQSSGEPFVHGSDWDLSFLAAQQNASDFVNVQKFSITEIARFFNVPADMIDGSVSGTADTYANISQRNLQFLILHLGPTIIRRERALSKLIPGNRFVRLNGDALLRLDPMSRSQMLELQLRSHQITVSEARALENRAPFTAEQKAEVLEHFPPRMPVSGSSGEPMSHE